MTTPAPATPASTSYAAEPRLRGRIADNQSQLLPRHGRSIDQFTRYLDLKRSVRQRPWRLLGLPCTPNP